MTRVRFEGKNETFGTRIRRLRQEQGLTQRQLAAKLDIDFTYLSKLENDRGEMPGETTVRRLAQVLDTDVEELLALAGRIPPALQQKARQDADFARFLRRLPDLSEEELRSMYRHADPDR